MTAAARTARVRAGVPSGCSRVSFPAGGSPPDRRGCHKGGARFVAQRNRLPRGSFHNLRTDLAGDPPMIEHLAWHIRRSPVAYYFLATRRDRTHLTEFELDAGLSMTLIEDTLVELREALIRQTKIEAAL